MRHGKHERLISGMAAGNTTNNRMELVAPADLLERINAIRGHAITFELVCGHAGHPDNERVDREARDQAERAVAGRRR